MTPADIGRIADRGLRMRLVADLYEAMRDKGSSYADIAVLCGMTRNMVAGDIRDARRCAERIVDNRDQYIPEPPRVVQHPLLRRPSPAKVVFESAVYDIEVASFDTTGEDAVLVLACFLDVRTGEMFEVRRDFDDPDDRLALQRVLELMGRWRILIGHNSRGFDFSWIASRCIAYGYPPPPFHHTVDTYQWAKMLPMRTRKGLGNLVDYFRLDGEKTAVQKTSWSGVFSKDMQIFEETMETISYHCRQDVIMTQQLMDALYPYMANLRKPSSLIKDSVFSASGV